MASPHPSLDPSLASPTNVDVAPSQGSPGTRATDAVAVADPAEDEANDHVSTMPESRSMSPEIPCTIKYDNITYEVLRPDELGCDIKDIPLFGERRSKARTAKSKKILKRKFEEENEIKWEDKRRITIEERLFNREFAGYSKTDMTITGDGLQLPELPAWLNATREFQSDGAPGVFLCRPSKEDFETRFLDILRALEPIGVEIGVAKICIPDECLDEPIPWSELKPDNPRSSQSPVRNLVLNGINLSTPTPSTSSTLSDSSATTESYRRPNKYASIIPHAEMDKKGIPQVFTMDQRLPLHSKSRSNIAPIYHVTSTPKVLVSGVRWRKDVILQLERERRIAAGDPDVQIYANLTEEAMVARGRDWVEIIQGNKGGVSKYSSDNDASDELRAYLGLKDPRLTALPGNVIHGSKNKVTGIHTPYLYIGKPYTLFALHAEDYNALSLNYQHLGTPKTWRVVCPRDFHVVESFVGGVIHPSSSPGKEVNKCSQFVRHASIFLPKQTLETIGARSIQFRQNPGELVVTWPLAYHEGWNEGVNVNEACGYGHKGWKKVFASAEGERGDERVYRPCGVKCIGGSPPIILSFDSEGAEGEVDMGEGESDEETIPETTQGSMSTTGSRKRFWETRENERDPVNVDFPLPKKLKVSKDEIAAAVNDIPVLPGEIGSINENIGNNPKIHLYYEPNIETAMFSAGKTIEDDAITKHIMMHRDQRIEKPEGDEESIEGVSLVPVQADVDVGEDSDLN